LLYTHAAPGGSLAPAHEKVQTEFTRSSRDACAKP